MGFAGNLQTLALPEVLQTLNRIKATGVLRLAAPEGGRDVVFDQGELVGVSFRRGEERQALLRRLILEKRLDAATAAQISSSGRESQIVARLIESGVLGEEAVKEAVQRQAEEELQSLFTWDYADFVFHDTGPEAEEVNAQVERARADGFSFNINSLLMESARRQDEWERVRQTFPDGGLVLGPREGMEAQLAEASQAYPAAAVVPLVDAVRSLDDIVRDSVVTRLDAWTVLAALLERGLVVPLTRDDIIYHGDYLVSKNDLLRACSLYRRALAARPSDQETARKLADCLARLGDAPEAAASYAQLALGALNAKDVSGAVTHARRAVQLAPAQPDLRQTLVRCLLAQDAKANAGEAVGELLQLVEAYTGIDRLEDARNTCLKVLELDKANEPARRQLARIFSSAARDEQSEDVVICVQCGHVNHREAQDCESCKASLLLTCLACGRPVGVSDRLCIFCGADPHRGALGRRAGGSPATSRIVNPDKVKAGAISGGRQAVADQLDSLVAAARAKEEAKDWQGALDGWKQVAALQVDNPDILAHIRSLETLVHDSFVEGEIERGHQFRRVRRYWAAISCYKAALRTLPSDDPRTQRLVEILASTTKVGQRIAALYAAAGLVILLGAGIALAPILKQRRIDGEIAGLQERLAPLAAAPSGPAISSLRREVDELDQRIAELGSSPRWTKRASQVAELRGELNRAWSRASASELDAVIGAIEQGDLKRARERIAAYQSVYQDDSPRTKNVVQQLEMAQKRRDELNARIQDAPRLLAGAEAEEAGGRLGSALAQFRNLAESPNADVAAKAKDAVGRLAPRSDAVAGAVRSALDAARIQRATDLVGADARLATVADEAAVWSLAEPVREERAAIAAALAAAKADAARLGPAAPVDQLAAFLARHPGAPEAAQVRQRHDGLVRASAARAQAQARFDQLIAERNWEAAWTAGRDLVAGYGPEAGGVLLPLVVETVPSGAAVKLDGKAVGTTPTVLRLAPGQRGEITIEATGFQPLSKRIDEVANAWRWAPALARAMQWRADLGRPVVGMSALAGGDLAVLTSDGLARLGDRGQLRWRAALAGDDLGGGRGRADLPVPHADGRILAAQPGSGVAVIDARGQIQRIATTAEVRGRPISYVNDVLGATPRIAFAAEAIFAGDPAAGIARIPLPSPAIAGPVAVAKDIDRVLVVADARGRLVGIEESTKRVEWEVDLQAADIGQLVPVGEDAVAVVLDGVRLACVGLTAGGASVRWTQQLDAPAVGDPVSAGGIVAVASGDRVVRVSVAGELLPACQLGSRAATAAAMDGERLVVASADGLLHLFRGADRLWSSPLGGAPAAVAIGPAGVYAASPTGVVAAFVP
jgi:tetratricopeptide (TPR) repeat protein